MSVYNKMLLVKVYLLIWFLTNCFNRNQQCLCAVSSKLNFEKISSFHWTVSAYFHPSNNLTATPFYFPNDADTFVDVSYAASFVTRDFARLTLKFHCDVDVELFTETVVIMNQNIEMNYMNYDCEQSKIVSWPVGIIKINVERTLLFLYSRHPLLKVEALLVLRRSFLITDKTDVLQQVVSEFGVDVVSNNVLQFFDITAINQHLCEDFFNNIDCNSGKIMDQIKPFNLFNILIALLLAVVWTFCICVSFCLKFRNYE